jgi:transcriptional antiterminator NusG
MVSPEPPVRQYFALQVAARGETRFLRVAALVIERFPGVRLFWPRRSLRIRRAGRWREILQPIFPGYLFLEADSLEIDLHQGLRGVPGFLRFLPSNRDVRPVSERDARPLVSLLRHGEIVRKSIAVFDEKNRIRIIEGPLKGLEGLIVKVDRRKGRAKVKLDLYDETRLVDFGFTSLEKGQDRTESR